MSQNEAYFKKYPDDIPSLHRILDFLAKNSVALPGGGLLTTKRLLGLGIFFGFHGGLDMVHQIIVRLATDLRHWGVLTRPSLSAVEAMGGLDNNIIYAVLHEPLYCSGTGASNWSAQRIGASLPEYEWLDKSDDYFTLGDSPSLDKPVYFTGEMILPHMFEVYPELFSLWPVADILAQTSDWPNPYDEAQLAKNEVPVYAATFMEDMYVDFGLAQETVQKTANVKQVSGVGDLLVFSDRAYRVFQAPEISTLRMGNDTTDFSGSKLTFQCSGSLTHFITTL